HGLPFVRVKLAMSLDGRTAMASGESQWITGPAARSAVQRLHGLPFVRVKLAMSLDGRTAMASGESQWITGPAA
ncbi:dihydrofolate reductase family protein, partial [Pseudomonas aeruginosa]